MAPVLKRALLVNRHYENRITFSPKKHSNMYKTKDRPGFARGDYMKVQELTGPHKGKWLKTCEVL